MRSTPFAVLCTIAALAGLVFAAFSTYDFAVHLDRQVHSIHCSFIPGLAAADATGSSGCHVTMMSPYSSVFRSSVWGGIPVSLAALSVFAFLLYRGVDFVVGRKDRGQAAFMLAAWGLPVLASAVMGFVAYRELHAACKLCIGIYSASAIGFAAALGALIFSGRSEDSEEEEDDASREGGGPLRHLLSFGQGLVFVIVPILVWLLLLPDFSGYVGTCGSLAKADDYLGVMVPMGAQNGGKKAIEVFDPLCPACRAFETRLEAAGLAKKLDRTALLFPLDSACNWMVTDSVHPGACAVSEAILCAGPGEADAIIDWAFENQEQIKAAATAEPKAAASLVGTQFPSVQKCVGSAAAKSKLNKSLRWAVANHLPLLTPQLYVDGVKLCDEDTDLGMDYALSRLIAGPAAPPKEGT